MPGTLVTVVIPTVTADSRLLDCLASLDRQTLRAFETIVVDNSGRRLVTRRVAAHSRVRVLEQARNVGFGSAINAGCRASDSPYIATLNDDAIANAGWLESLVRAIEKRPDAGMCASQVRLFGEDLLDSAGMLVCRDGSSKQRGHFRPPHLFPVEEEVLFPSGSAALYRRTMLEEIGLFDDDFFLYCEDSDLGLRARWAGWTCLYVPSAIVEHHYSHSAGKASPLKAYYVERNRLFVLVKNFPAGLLAAAPFVSAVRYAWHLVSIAQGRGSAARFRLEGNSGMRMAWCVAKAHLALIRHGRRLWRQRSEIRHKARVSPSVYRQLMQSHAISARKVAQL